MSKTLNKDGTPRKIGSGKTKGAGCFSPTTWSILKNFIADDVEFPVSRVWLRELGALEGDPVGKKKSAEPAVLSSSPAKDLQLELETNDSQQRVKKEKAEEEEISTAKVEGVEAMEDEYEPPPLFAATPNKFRQY
ncbi:MAG: hypothetical protein HN531_07050 [Opitutae bacterium]|jgi:hypothetical protein|nr:hypothetical protein [Opitutae bacterium]